MGSLIAADVQQLLKGVGACRRANSVGIYFRGPILCYGTSGAGTVPEVSCGKKGDAILYKVGVPDDARCASPSWDAESRYSDL
jgi:hypothetical protein